MAREREEKDANRTLQAYNPVTPVFIEALEVSCLGRLECEIDSYSAHGPCCRRVVQFLARPFVYFWIFEHFDHKLSPHQTATAEE